MREYVVVNAQLIDLQDLSPQLGKFALQFRARRKDLTTAFPSRAWHCNGKRRGEPVARDFSAAPFRDLFYNSHQARDLVRCQMFLRETQQRTNASAGACSQHDSGCDILSKSQMGNGKSSCFEDVWVAQKNLFYLGGRNLLPPTIDDVLKSSNDKEIPVSIQISKIPGAKPPFAKRIFVGGDIIAIPPRNCWASQINFSAFTRGQRPSLPIHDRDFGPSGPPNRVGLPPRERVGGDLGGGLRHTVGLDHGNREQGFQATENVGR